MKRIGLVVLALLALVACNLTGNVDPTNETEDIAPDTDAALTGWSKPRFIAAGYASKVVTSSTGEVYVAGYYAAKYQAYLRKYSASGVYQWMKALPKGTLEGIPVGSSPISIAVSVPWLHMGTDGNVYAIAKYSYSPGPKSGVIIHKVYVYSPQGILLRRFLLDVQSIHQFLAMDKDNNLYTATSTIKRVFPPKIEKYSATGTKLWSKTLDGAEGVPYTADLAQLLIDPKGNLVVMGHFYANNSIPYRSLLSYDPAGNLITSMVLPGYDFGSHDETAVFLSDGRMVLHRLNTIVVYDSQYRLLSKLRYQNQISSVVSPRVFSPWIYPPSVAIKDDTLTIVGQLLDGTQANGYIVQLGLDGSFKKGFETKQGRAYNLSVYDDGFFVVGPAWEPSPKQPKKVL